MLDWFRFVCFPPLGQNRPLCQLGGSFMTLKFGRRAVVAVAAALSFANPVFAGGHQVVDSIHFLIPGGAGGGWDGTARGT